jgi:hypothetical protein
LGFIVKIQCQDSRSGFRVRILGQDLGSGSGLRVRILCQDLGSGFRVRN